MVSRMRKTVKAMSESVKKKLFDEERER